MSSQSLYALSKTTLKTLINYLPGDRQPIIAELWTAYGYYFFILPIQDPYILRILQAAHI